MVKRDSTFDKTFELSFFAFGDYGLFVCDLIDQLIDVGSKFTHKAVSYTHLTLPTILLV